MAPGWPNEHGSKQFHFDLEQYRPDYRLFDSDNAAEEEPEFRPEGDGIVESHEPGDE